VRNEGAAGESARSATAGKPSCGYSRRRVTTVTASRVGGSRGGRPRSWARFASAQSLAHRSVAGPKADGSPPTRRTWAFLLLWGGVWALLAARGGGYSWHYFAQGADLLIHVGTPGAGLQLYAAHPDLQIGPLALLAAVPLQAAGPVGGRVLAQVILTLLGPLLLVVLCRARPSAAGQLVTARQLLVTGLLVLPVWAQLATHFTHLDDALALAFTVGAVAAVIHRRGVTAALLLAAAVDAKPWALGFTVLLLALPAGQRRRAALVTGAGVAIAWLPFLLADPRTLAAGGFTIDNADDSALRALGVHTGGTPAWDRPAQLLLGVAVALLCLRRGRWAAVPLAVVATRLLLDPQTYGYYSSGLLVTQPSSTWPELGAGGRSGLSPPPPGLSSTRSAPLSCPPPNWATSAPCTARAYWPSYASCPQTRRAVVGLPGGRLARTYPDLAAPLPARPSRSGSGSGSVRAPRTERRRRSATDRRGRPYDASAPHSGAVRRSPFSGRRQREAADERAAELTGPGPARDARVARLCGGRRASVL